MFYSNFVNVNRIHRRKEVTVKCSWMFSVCSEKRYKGVYVCTMIIIVGYLHRAHIWDNHFGRLLGILLITIGQA